MFNPAPFPWHRADSTQVIAADGSHVADCSHSEPAVGDDRFIATSNARLIAAAPDMLAALRALLHQCEYMGAPSDHPDMAAARAAIAKATAP